MERYAGALVGAPASRRFNGLLQAPLPTSAVESKGCWPAKQPAKKARADKVKQKSELQKEVRAEGWAEEGN